MRMKDLLLTSKKFNRLTQNMKKSIELGPFHRLSDKLISELRGMNMWDIWCDKYHDSLGYGVLNKRLDALKSFKEFIYPRNVIK